MTGLQWTTTSPSSVSSSRNTPCVDGCWGPILIVSSSRLSFSFATAGGRCRTLGACLSRPKLLLLTPVHPPGHREIDRLAAQRLGSPQRVALPLGRQHDAFEPRVTRKFDPKQVEQLAFIPVGARHERSDARRATIGARLEPQPPLSLHRMEQIHQLEALVAGE